MDGGSRQRRLTRRQARESRRQTRRFQWEQAGGGDALLTQVDAFQTAATGFLAPEDVRDELKFMFKPSGEWTADDYVNVIAWQDEIGDAIVKKYTEILGVPPNAESSVILDKIGKYSGTNKYSGITLLTIIANIITGFPITTFSKTEFYKLARKSDFELNDTSIYKLLIFPYRTHNIFVSGIASILDPIVHLKSSFTGENADTNIKLYTQQLIGYLYSLSYSQTGSDLIDSLSIFSKKLAEGAVIIPLIEKLIRRLISSDEIESMIDLTKTRWSIGTELPGSDGMLADVISNITARIYQLLEERGTNNMPLFHYFLGKIPESLTSTSNYPTLQFTDSGTTEGAYYTARKVTDIGVYLRDDLYNGPNNKGVPTKSMLKLPLMSTRKTFQHLLFYFSPEQVHYIIQLCHALDVLKKEGAATETEPPTKPGTPATTA